MKDMEHVAKTAEIIHRVALEIDQYVEKDKAMSYLVSLALSIATQMSVIAYREKIELDPKAFPPTAEDLIV